MSDEHTGGTRGGAFVQFYRWVFGVGHERNAIVAVAVFVSGLYSTPEARVQYCPLDHTIGRSTCRE